jgi:Fe2+ transport system protein FeoA
MKTFKIISCKHPRLNDLGFLPGVVFELVLKNIFGVVVIIHGTTFALRKSDWENIESEEI